MPGPVKLALPNGDTFLGAWDHATEKVWQLNANTASLIMRHVLSRLGLDVLFALCLLFPLACCWRGTLRLER